MDSMTAGKMMLLTLALVASQRRRLSVVTKIFMTKDAKIGLRGLLGPDYSDEAQQWFDQRGYMSIAQLGALFGRGGR